MLPTVMAIRVSKIDIFSSLLMNRLRKNSAVLSESVENCQITVDGVWEELSSTDVTSFIYWPY